jgi:homospermidine synthase
MQAELRAVVIMGFGNIGQALAPLLRRRFRDVPVCVIDDRMSPAQVNVAETFGFTWQRGCLRADTYVALLQSQVREGTLLLNLATSIDSLTVLCWAQSRGAWYLDTCIDPWVYHDGELATGHNTNYRMRHAVLERQAAQRQARQVLPTAVVAHGANPGMVSILAKEALMRMARRWLTTPVAPAGRAEWAQLAQTLGVRVIQVSERDTQSGTVARAPGEFVNTWSVDGFVAEALQPVEMGWGTHEAHGQWQQLVRGHAVGDRSGVYAPRLGVHTRVKTRTPAAGEVTAWLISHNEAFSIASWLTLQQGGQVVYRPTVYYAYHPCDEAAASLALLEGGDRSKLRAARVLKDEISGGIDELGVLLLSDRFPALWFGSQLSAARARALAPCNNATSLQVVSSVMGAVAWVLQNPLAGIVESEDLDHALLMQHAAPCWEPLVEAVFDWHPAGEAARTTVPMERRWCLDQFVVDGQPATARARLTA